MKVEVEGNVYRKVTLWTRIKRNAFEIMSFVMFTFVILALMSLVV